MEDVTVDSVGAETLNTSTAEAGNAEVTFEAGAETLTGTAEGQGEESNTTSQEADVTAVEGEGNKDRGAHQKTLEERAAEIAERRFKELEARFEERMKAQQPDFDPPEVEAQVQQNIVAATVRLRSIESELELGGEIDPAVTAEYFNLKRWIQSAESALSENQKKRMAWEEKNRAAANEAQVVSRINSQIAEAAPIVAQSLGITREAWDSGEKWFAERRKQDPALNAEYRERCFKHGVFPALRWAAEYVQREMGKAAEAAKSKKETGKEKVLGAGGETSGDTFAGVRTWNDLMKLPSKDINRFSKEHPKRFAELKNRHFR